MLGHANGTDCLKKAQGALVGSLRVLRARGMGWPLKEVAFISGLSDSPVLFRDAVVTQRVGLELQRDGDQLQGKLCDSPCPISEEDVRLALEL